MRIKSIIFVLAAMALAGRVTAEVSDEMRQKLNLESTSRFFAIVPELDNNKVVLDFQNRFIDRILSVSLQYAQRCIRHCLSPYVSRACRLKDRRF